MNNINSNTQTTKFNGPQVAQPSIPMPTNDPQHAFDKLNEMLAPGAAEINSPQAAQPSIQMPMTDLQHALDKLNEMLAPEAAKINSPQAAEPDYLSKYKSRGR